MTIYYIVTKKTRLDRTGLKVRTSYDFSMQPPDGSEDYIADPNRRYPLYVYKVSVKDEAAVRGARLQIDKNIPSSRVELTDVFLTEGQLQEIEDKLDDEDQLDADD